MTRALLRLQHAALGLCGFVIGLLPYFPHPLAWHYLLGQIEEQRDLIRAELAEVQP